MQNAAGESTFGATVREARMAAGIAQADAARSIGVAASTLSRWENERTVPSSARTVSRTARTLGLDFAVLADLLEAS